MIDDLDRDVARIDRELKALGADHPYIPLLMTVPGIAWVLGYTIAAEIGDIDRFASPKKLTGYTGLCPRVYQSGDTDRRGPLTQARPQVPALGADRSRRRTPVATPPIASATSATRHGWASSAAPRSPRSTSPAGSADAIWHMLTRNEPFAPAGAARSGRLTALSEMRHRSETPIEPDPPTRRR